MGEGSQVEARLHDSGGSQRDIDEPFRGADTVGVGNHGVSDPGAPAMAPRLSGGSLTPWLPQSLALARSSAVCLTKRRRVVADVRVDLSWLVGALSSRARQPREVVEPGDQDEN